MKKLIAILLAFLLLFSDIGFTMGTHICRGHAVKTKLMIGEQTLDCGMMKMAVPCNHKNTANGINPQTCCHTQYKMLQVKDNFDFSKISFVSDFNFSAILFNTLLQPLVGVTALTFHYLEDTSPPVANNILLLFQSFLI